MEKYADKLKELLMTEPTFTVEDKVNKNYVASLARQYDKKLLELLSKDKELSEFFFSDINGSKIFKKDVFLSFINNKEFLPDSYTIFKSRIGLGVDADNYLSEDSRVVLNWPYKDCVLEGGQDREDQKRNEVFFNEILAPDQINTILEDKVFTNWKRYDKDGERDLDELKPEDNLIIKGNNLVVLHSLKKRFAGKIKLIYIDPPFNTGGDSFGYNDRFNHSTWLTFMKNRIEIAKELLSEDGTFIIHVDENENAYLRVLCDELLGRENFVNEIIWHYKSFVGQVKNYFPKKHDTIFVYKKKTIGTFHQARLDIPVEQMSDYKNWGKYIVNGNEIRGNYYPKDVRFERNLNKWKKNNPGREPGKDDVLYIFQSQPVDDVWVDIDYLDPKNKTERTEFTGGQKPEALLARIINTYTNEGDIVLDYHLGSGTTAVVAHKLKRQYVGIEQMSYIDNITTKRLNTTIQGNQGGISESVNWTGGGSFVYCSIKNDANIFREKVRQANEKELEGLLEQVLKSSFLSYRVDPRKASKKEFEKLSLADKKRVLIDLVDNNTLYLNYSEINDNTYNISEADKKHNKEFYGD